MALRRRRIAKLIEAALGDRAVALVIAPPGHGKSIALRNAFGDVCGVRWLEPRELGEAERALREAMLALLYHRAGRKIAAAARRGSNRQTRGEALVADALRRSGDASPIPAFVSSVEPDVLRRRISAAHHKDS
ncbi:MAG: hypothetical protein ABSB70_14365 [Candidatus Velthaea sp.]|jgi:hypothetical protein